MITHLFCRFIILLAIALAPALHPVRPVHGGSAPGAKPYNLTIFHTNDMHGAFLPEPASWRDDRADVGGCIALGWHLERQRRTAAPSLLLDAGDFMTGNPICEIEVDGIKGAGFIDMMNALGYDLGVIGNHEFDNGRQNARLLAARADFPLLAGDILDERGDPIFAQEPVIFKRGGLRIGVMGVSCRGLFGVTAKSRTAGLSLRDQATMVREWIPQLEPHADLLVLVTHNGVQGDRKLAENLAGSGLDVIVGGHSHTRLEEPEKVGDILIVQAGSHMKNLGRLDLRVEDDRVVRYRGQLIPLEAAGAQADSRLTGLVRDYSQRVDRVFGQVIGTLATDWDRDSRGESNIGNWLTDRLRETAQADVAFLNSGTIRKGLPAGPIRLLDIHEILPFSNMLLTFELTGAELLTIVNENAAAAVSDTHGTLQISGLRYAYREVGDHVEVQDVTVGGRPLRRDQVYKAAAPDYVVGKSDQYFNLPAPQTGEYGVTVTDAIVEAVRAAVTVRAETDGRIRDLTGISGSK